MDIPAAYPGVTAVGGTAFATGSITYDSTGLAEGYGPEKVWNDDDNPVFSMANLNGAESGGGGISNVWARPSYQSGLTQCPIVGSLPTSVSPANRRQVPDLSLNAGLSETPDLIMCEFSNSTQDCAASGTNDSLNAVGERPRLRRRLPAWWRSSRRPRGASAWATSTRCSTRWRPPPPRRFTTSRTATTRSCALRAPTPAVRPAVSSATRPPRGTTAPRASGRSTPSTS